MTTRFHIAAAVAAFLTLMGPSAVTAGIEVGACCVGDTCEDNGGLGLDRDTCEQILGGTFQGDGSDCRSVTCTPVPTLSSFGLATMAVLMLAGGTLVYHKRNPARR